MSDTIDPAMSEHIKSSIMSDRRYATIDMAAAVATELRDCNALRMFLAALAKEAQDALVDFADANVANLSEIVPLQARVKSIVFLNRTIEQLMMAAKAAEEQIFSESRERPEEYDG